MLTVGDALRMVRRPARGGRVPCVLQATSGRPHQPISPMNFKAQALGALLQGGAGAAWATGQPHIQVDMSSRRAARYERAVRREGIARGEGCAPQMRERSLEDQCSRDVGPPGMSAPIARRVRLGFPLSAAGPCHVHKTAGQHRYTFSHRVDLRVLCFVTNAAAGLKFTSTSA